MAYTELSRIDRLYRTFNLAEILKGPVPDGITGAQVALLPVRSGGPDSATAWVEVDYDTTDDTFTVLFSGPDASSSGALAVPASADLWVKVAATPEVDAIKVGRVAVLGGSGTFVAPNPTYVVLPPGGVDGQVLGLVGGVLTWVTPTAGSGGGSTLGLVGSALVDTSTIAA